MAKNEGKVKFRFNIIDALLILVILAAAVLLVWIFSSSNLNLFGSSEKVEIEYTVELRQIRDEFRGDSFFTEGDPVTDTVTLYDIGELISVSYSNAIYTGVNDNGELVVSDYPNHINITLTIRAEADVSDDEYSLGGYKIAVGKAVSLRIPDFTGEGYCTSITETDG